jgi:hypothetical protein
MHATRLLAPLAAAALAILAFPGAAHAATLTQPFAADSGDACRYGATSGTLTWQYGVVSPLPAVGVDVKGRLDDRPLLADPGAICQDDGYYSTAIFTAYTGSTAVDQQVRSVNNGTLDLEFVLAGNAATTSVDRVVIQVCRSPLVTLPPSYCGKAVTYFATQPLS